MASTFAGKLATRIGLLVVAVVLIAAAAVAALLSLQQQSIDLDSAHRQLRGLYEVGHHCASSLLLLRQDPPDGAAAREQLQRAAVAAQALVHNPDDGSALPTRAVAALVEPIDRALVALQQPQSPVTDVQVALSHVANLTGRLRGHIGAQQAQTQQKIDHTLLVIAVLGGVTVVASVLIGLRQYRDVMRPLRSLHAAVAGLSRGDFNQAVPALGNPEFDELGTRFNTMAQELDSLYRDLREKVEARSRQLVRSEQLASVGYLAAGLAHEINNPLQVIAGYAEAAPRKFARAASHEEALQTATRLMTLIGEEAFRCSRITGELLHLAQPAHTRHGRVDLLAIARRVAALLAGLPEHQGCRLTVEHQGPGGACEVIGDESELTQVLLNVVGNALRAVRGAEHARVRVVLSGEGRRRVVRVEDNGRGMSRDVLSRVFEPFFTDAPSRDEQGCGLGLSVTHAIVERHHGAITARSDGPGRGSEFTIELPAADGDGAEPAGAAAENTRA